MELEDLKRSWERLTLRLEREEIVRRQEMERLLTGKVRSYLLFSQHLTLLNAAIVPVCIAIGKFRGLADGVIVGLVLCYIVLSLPSLWGLWLLGRAARCEGDIVELERRMTRYARFSRGCLIFQATVGVLLTAFLMWASGYYTAHGMWLTVAAMLVATLLVCVVAVRYERCRLREVRRRIRELREFSAE